MENQLINDPQQYSEDWFNIANIPIGKEFELPNISNTFNHQLIENMAMPNNSLQIPLNQTNPLNVDVACDTPNQYFTLPSVAATPVLVENRQVVTTTTFITNPSLPYGPSLPISQNQICVQTTITTTKRYGLSTLITMRNRVPILNTISSNGLGINIPMRNLRTHVHSFPNPPRLYPNESIHARYQQPHFAGISENPSPYPNPAILSNITAPNGSIPMTANPMHAPSITNTRYSCLNSQPLPNIGNQPIHMPTIASTSRCCSNGNLMSNQPIHMPTIASTSRSFSNGNLMSNQANHHEPSCFDASVLLKNQETNAPNDHLITPKQEPHDPDQASSSQLNVGPNHTSHLQNPTKIPSSPSEDSKPPGFHEKMGKKKTIGSQSEVKRDHKCFVCNLSFASGYALGGHMSSHAKKRKMEAMRNGFFKPDQPVLGFGDSRGVGDGSAHPPNASTKTSDSAAAANEKIEGSEPSNEQEVKSTKIKVEVEEEDESSPPFKVARK